jgi:hypothetical protein
VINIDFSEVFDNTQYTKEIFCAMLPPIDPFTLEQNPGFSSLYKDLTTRKLNPDGSSKDLKSQRAHDEVRKVGSGFEHVRLFSTSLGNFRFTSFSSIDPFPRSSTPQE